MIVGVGIDIIDNRRIAKLLIKYDEKFKSRCFLKKEINKAESKNNEIQSLSKLYAAKEACVKALGIGFTKGIYWKDIEIFSNSYGKPLIKLHNNALIRLNSLTKKKCKIELSLSDEKNYSIANVIIYNYEKNK